jgi:hypothetical protein
MVVERSEYSQTLRLVNKIKSQFTFDELIDILPEYLYLMGIN